MKSFRWAFILGPALVAALAVPLSGQGTATLRGVVIDREVGDSLVGALVRISGREPMNTDSLGRFEIADLPPGQVEVTVQVLGFRPLTERLLLAGGEVLNRTFLLEFTGDRLPDVVVRARADRLAPRYSDFERRRSMGAGAFFRWDEIKARGFSSVGDALRTVRGVRIRCDQAAFECHAVMSRSPGCFPSWWIDGVRVQSFHENTSIRDIYGIEIYRGAGEIPADFGGSTAGCGVIVIWTKSRPYQ